MTVIVVDSRWPDLIPRDAIPHLDDAYIAHGWDEEARDRERAGEQVFVAASLSDPVWQAREVMAAARARGGWEQAQTHESFGAIPLGRIARGCRSHRWPGCGAVR